MKYYDAKHKIIQFLKFGIVGILNTVISYLVYVICIKLGISYIYGNTIGFFAGNMNSFIWNNKYVFKTVEKRNLISTYFKQLLSCAFTGIILNNVLLYVIIEFLHINEFFAPIIILFFTVPLNYLISKFWAYKN